MKGLLALAHWVDALNDRFAAFARWAVLAACFISAGNARFTAAGGVPLPGVRQ